MYMICEIVDRSIIAVGNSSLVSKHIYLNFNYHTSIDYSNLSDRKIYSNIKASAL